MKKLTNQVPQGKCEHEWEILVPKNSGLPPWRGCLRCSKLEPLTPPEPQELEELDDSGLPDNSFIHVAQPSEESMMKHVADPKIGKWYHLDDMYRIWSCGCFDGNGVSLCLTIDESLKREGELRDLDRKIAEKRKLLGLKIGEPMPDGK